MAGKFSGGKAKQFFVHHGEKLALGVIALLVLYALGTANWVPYDGDPHKIVEEAEQAKAAYDARKIQPEEEKELGLVIAAADRPKALVDREMLMDWSGGSYDLRIPLAASPHDLAIPKKEAGDLFERHPIRNLIAGSSYVLLNLGPEEPPPVVDPAATPEGSTAPPALAQAGTFPGSALDDRFAERTTTATGGAGGEAGAGYMEMYYSPELEYYDEYAANMEGGEMSYAGTKLKGIGRPYVSVRGIIPLHELIRDVAEARNCSFAEAAQFFQLIDYQLERQVAAPDGTWPAEDKGWEPVDRQTAISILEEVDGFDLDPVPPPLTDVAVTMPLPARITGVWNVHATHPDLVSFSLSQEDMENELKFQRALLTKMQEQQAQQQAVVQENAIEVGGWSQMMYDSRRLAATALGEESYYNGGEYEDYYASQSEESLYGTIGAGQNDPKLQQLVTELEKIADKDGKDQALKEYIKSRVTAVGNLILFRYVDFAVEPGKTYRYRARLEIENPNYGEHVITAAAPSVVEGETRLNSWSNITDPVTVDRDTYYFVHSIDSRRNQVELDYFHFDPQLGTIVTNTEPDPPEEDNVENIKRLTVGFGEPVGGRMDVWELSPAAYTFQKDEVEGGEDEMDDDEDPKGYFFQTGDLLVAALEDVDVDRSQHPGLSIPKEQNYDMQLADAVLIQKKDGTLSQLDTLTQQNALAYQVMLVGRQNEPYRDLKQGPIEPGSELCPCIAGLYMNEYMDPTMADGGARRANKRSRTALRKSGSRADPGGGARTGGSRTGRRPPAP